MSKEKIEVTVPGARSRFEGWIQTSGGVKIWVNCDLSNPNAGEMFTPALDDTGNPYPAPHWAYQPDKIITDINQFRFILKEIEAARFRVHTRMGRNGLRIKLTDKSSEKVHGFCEEITNRYQRTCGYRFDYDTQECVILVPVWEGETEEQVRSVGMKNVH